MYERQGKFNEATNAFQQSYDIFDKLKDHRGQMVALSKLGSLYLEQGELNKAVIYLKDAFHLYESMEDDYKESHTLNTFGKFLTAAMHVVEATEYNQRVTHIYSQNKELQKIQSELSGMIKTGMVRLIRPAYDGDYHYGYIALDPDGDTPDKQNVVRMDSRFINMDGLVTGMRVQVAVKTLPDGKLVAKWVKVVSEELCHESGGV
ncbi:MAG: tetratricopeptide repeat protein [Chloroflexota bacterium]